MAFFFVIFLLFPSGCGWSPASELQRGVSWNKELRAAACTAKGAALQHYDQVAAAKVYPI